MAGIDRVRRIVAMAATVTIAAGALVLTSAAAGAADPAIVPQTSSVALGGTLAVSATGCPRTEPGAPPPFVLRTLSISLVTQTTGGEVLVGDALPDRTGRLVVRVPGWVDPADPAVLVGRCREIAEVDDGAGDGYVETDLFTYPDVAVDVTPGTGTAPTPAFTLDRPVAAGGQVLVASPSGCPSGTNMVNVGLFEGDDASGRERRRFVAGGSAVTSDLAGTIEVPLLSMGSWSEELGMEVGAGPLPEGRYTARLACARFAPGEDPAFWQSAPRFVDVVGTNPSGAITVLPAEDDALEVRGEGCTGGRTVTARFVGSTEGAFEARHEAEQRSRATGTMGATDHEGSGEVFDDAVAVEPAEDGSWSMTWTPPAAGYAVEVDADCGDPTADGFRYVRRYFEESALADLFLERVSPTASPVRGTITVHGEGRCDDVPSLIVARHDGTAAGAPGTLRPVDGTSFFAGQVAAPSLPGSYVVVPTCGDEHGYPQELQVFEPQPVAGAALPPDPVDGWPSTGDRAVYEGRIGPITLDGGEHGEMLDAQLEDLGSAGSLVDVPRPDGDFAITRLAFDLVDADGTPVAPHDAHLHHLVLGDQTSSNPACPDGTFGLPGGIVGAAGAERTVVDLPDPYGIPVEASDRWAGVYDVMNMSGAPQTVYLTYDIEYRRDVGNVRPVTTYFGSAAGCDQFGWTLHGSGTPDVQSTYVELAAPGRLVGAGSHLHNGASHASLVDDRGREVCRSTVAYDHGGHGGHGSPDAPLEPGGYPPEMYPDDPPIASISTCALAERVQAGQRLRFDAVYDDERPRSGVMGIFVLYVWEGGGPADPARPDGPTGPGGPDGRPPAAGPADAIRGRPTYTG